METSSGETNLLQRGVIVFVVLLALTAAEFGVAVALNGSVPLLAIVAVAKAAAIVVYYMHIGKLGSSGEGEH